jgi:hypothetical protein
MVIPFIYWHRHLRACDSVIRLFRHVLVCPVDAHFDRRRRYDQLDSSRYDQPVADSGRVARTDVLHQRHFHDERPAAGPIRNRHRRCLARQRNGRADRRAACLVILVTVAAIFPKVGRFRIQGEYDPQVIQAAVPISCDDGT